MKVLIHVWLQYYFCCSDNEAKFYVLPENVATKTDELEAYKQLLLSATPLKPELDRNPLVDNAYYQLPVFMLHATALYCNK